MHLSFDIQVFFRIHLFFLSDPQNVHIDLNILVLLFCGAEISKINTLWSNISRSCNCFA